MATEWSYTVLDRSGRRSRGSMAAEHRTIVIDRLLADGLHPLEVQVRNGAGAGHAGGRDEPLPKVPRGRIEAFTHALANLLAAGVSLSRALATLSRETSHPGARRCWERVRADVVGGASLADAMARMPHVFPEIHVAMVRAGEAGGFLAVVLQQIADFQVREQELKGRVKAALVYPLVLLVLAVGVVAFLLTYFIPRFSAIFSEFGESLPWLTQLIVGASEMFLRHGLVLVGLVLLGVFLLRHSLRTPAGRRGLDRVLLATPGLGVAVARFALVRFCRMLGTLVGSGVPLLAALRAAREAIGNQPLADAVDRAIEEVRRGAPLARSLAVEPRLFPPSVVEMVAVAEETGRLDKELVRMATTYEGELERRLRMLVAVTEPAMLFVMALVIGTVVIGMLLPVFTLQDLIR